MQLVIEAWAYKISLFFATEVQGKMNTHISMVMEGIQAQCLPVRGCVKLNLVYPCCKWFFICELVELSIVVSLSV